MSRTPCYQAMLPDAEYWKRLVPCQTACPAHTDAGRYVQLIAQGEYESAYHVARSPNPWASVCARVCAAPCEDNCRRGKIDSPVTIRALKRVICQRFGPESQAPLPLQNDYGNKTAWHFPVLQRERANVGQGRKVAVIGAGPAGLACAHDLAIMGYRPTVFEASSIAGGMAFQGIPEFRLVRSVLQAQVEELQKLGVEIRLNTALSRRFGLRHLRAQEYEAVFLGVGTQSGRDLAAPGVELDGIVKAVEFLLNVNRGYRITLGKKVVVIGGGFVAFDAARAALRTFGPEPPGSEGLIAALDVARTALRAGGSEVHMVSLESFEEMPVLRTCQGHEEFEQAKREGITFHPQRGVRAFRGQDGRVQSIDLIGVRRTYDQSGRFSPEYDPAVAETMAAESVILAIGQRADLSFLSPEDGVELTPQGTIHIDVKTLATSAPGVFAGGDVAFGPRNLIEAVANGKQAALSIDSYLRRSTPVSCTLMRFRQLRTATYKMPARYELGARVPPPTIPSERRTGVQEVELPFSEEQARAQAERCLHCHTQTIYDAGKCVLCGRCVDVCPENSLKLVPLEQLAIAGVAQERVLEFYQLKAVEQPLSAMIKNDERCIRCGLCAQRCPTGAMTMEVLNYEDRQPVAAAIGATA
ncbi:MAG: FAD-dependent oxidoreductase [Chlamydiota bacterium]